MKPMSQSIKILTIIAILITTSGCIDLDNNYAFSDSKSNISVPITMIDNNSLVYGGQLHLQTTDSGGYLKVMRMYDTAENNVCYITYNGIDCLKREVK